MSYVPKPEGLPKHHPYNYDHDDSHRIQLWDLPLTPTPKRTPSARTSRTTLSANQHANDPRTKYYLVKGSHLKLDPNGLPILDLDAVKAGQPHYSAPEALASRTDRFASPSTAVLSAPKPAPGQQQQQAPTHAARR